MATVSLWKGESRYENIGKALKLLEPELKGKITQSERILIKPNFVSDTIHLASTHVDAVKAVLDFVAKYTDKKILIAEGAAHDTFTAFKNFGFLKLESEYNIELLDLNMDKKYVRIIGYDSEFKPMELRASKTAVESDCRISVCPMKTHDTVIATLSLKNMAVGSLLRKQHFPAGRYIGKVFGPTPIKTFRDYKSAIHQGYRAINKNLFELAKVLRPHISVIDAFEAMEGEGPAHGTAVPMHLALAGADFLAVDTAAAKLMGFDIDQIGYLYYCKEAGLGEGDIKKIKIVGNADIEKEKRKFKTHSTFEEQLKWKI